MYQLKVIASTDVGQPKSFLDQFDTTRNSCEEVGKRENDQDMFQLALDEIDDDGLFGSVEIAALRLASVKNDPMLSQAIESYQDGIMGSFSFRQALLEVADRVIEEADAGI